MFLTFKYTLYFRYMLNDKQLLNANEISINISICIDSGTCMARAVILNAVLLPKPVCDYKQIFKIKGENIGGSLVDSTEYFI